MPSKKWRCKMGDINPTLRAYSRAKRMSGKKNSNQLRRKGGTTSGHDGGGQAAAVHPHFHYGSHTAHTTHTQLFFVVVLLLLFALLALLLPSLVHRPSTGQPMSRSNFRH